jgi:hypothetical protein
MPENDKKGNGRTSQLLHVQPFLFILEIFITYIGIYICTYIGIYIDIDKQHVAER